MSAIVKDACPLPAVSGIVNADPVRGVTWHDIGAAANHLLGRGGVCIPTTSVFGDAIEEGTTSTYYVALFPRYQATHRVWNLGLAPAAAGTEARVTFTDPSGGSSAWIVNDGSALRPFRHIETIGSRTASAVQTTVTLAATAGKDHALGLTMGCYEVSRPELALDASDAGVDVDTLGGGLPIYADTGLSIGGAIDATEAAAGVARRNGLVYVLSGSESPFAFTTTSYVNPLGGQVRALDRKKYRGETVRAVDVYAYGMTGATTTMDVRVSSAGAGDSVVLSWAAGDTGSWKSAQIEIVAEDLSDSRGGTDDVLTIEGKRTTGANSAHLHSVCIGGT